MATSTPANPTVPPADYANATVFFGVDIHPHFAGSTPLTLSGSKQGILSATVTKSIRDPKGGAKFTINLAPGGPNGPNDPNTWTNIIQPMSLAVLYAARGSSRRIVMLGIVQSIRENQVWSNNRVQRIITIEGTDFSCFFNSFSFYLMTYLGLINSGQFPSTAPLGAAIILGKLGDVYQAPPAGEAYFWLTLLMLGITPVGTPASTDVIGVLQNTFITYNGKVIYLKDIFGWWFEPFIEQNKTAFIPFMTDLMNSEGSWTDKFLSMLQFPWYEFFVITATDNDFPQIFGGALVSPSTDNGYAQIPNTAINVQNNPFMPITGFDSVFPMVIGRVNPLPWIAGFRNDATPVTANVANLTLEDSRWNDLNTFSLGTNGFISSSVAYTERDVRNFYSIITTDARIIAQNGSSGSLDPTLYSFQFFGGLLDRISINNYGYRPYLASTRWMTAFPSTGSADPLDANFVANILLGKLASYYTPTPVMLNSALSFPIWPDIIPGNRFVYNPFKSGPQYEFYIEAVTHSYTFGGPSVTTLSLSRGLPTSAYSTQNQMIGIHTSTYSLVNGTIAPIPTAQINGAAGLTWVSTATLAQVTGNGSVYTVPTPKTPSSTTS